MKELQEELKRSQQEGEKRLKESSQKEQELSSFLSEFSSTSKFISAEIKRIKEDSNQIIKQAKAQEQNKWKTDLRHCSLMIEALKKSQAKGTAALLKETEDLKSRYNLEMRQIVSHFEGVVYTLEQESSKLSEILDQKDGEIERLTEEIKLLQQNYMVLEGENRRAIEHFEDKISHFKEMMKKDNWNFENLKKDASSELDTLRKENRQLKNDLGKREKIIAQLKTEIDEERVEMRALRSQQLITVPSVVSKPHKVSIKKT